jgi:hypothetical protein
MPPITPPTIAPILLWCAPPPELGSLEVVGDEPADVGDEPADVEVGYAPPAGVPDVEIGLELSRQDVSTFGPLPMVVWYEPAT